LFIDTNGNVGIGTPSPTVRPDVAGATRNPLHFETIKPISVTARALYVTGDFDQDKGWSFVTVMEPRELASDITLSMPRETT